MKHKIVAIMLALVFVFNGCIGSFTLTNKIYTWNKKATGDKYVNSAIMWILGFFTPVYAGTLLIDAAILNVIEFWSGQNPVAFGNKKILKETITTETGTYTVTMGNYNITIDKIEGIDAGKTTTLHFDPTTSTFYISDRSSTPIKIGTIQGTTLYLYSPDGTVVSRSLNQTGTVQTSLR